MAQYIPVDFSEITRHYPRRSSKEGQFGGKLEHPDLRRFMSSIPGTPCCVQVSHAFNMMGHLVPQTYTGMRRRNSAIKVGGVTYFYILAVDEMEVWLTEQYGPGEFLRGPSNPGASAHEIKAAIRNRPGLLTLWGKKDRWHTEFWNGSRWFQPDISDAILENPRICFWDVGHAPASWLVDYMATA